MKRIVTKALTTIMILTFAGNAGATMQVKEPAKVPDNAVSVAGKWTMALETPHGKLALVITLKVDGKKVTGTLTSEQMGDTPLTGEFVDGRLTFTATNDNGDLTLNAKLKDADTLVGNLSSHIGDLACVATRVKAK